ncbi:MAG: FAD-dependent thymidylate synthase [Magnetococcales bacterium]|nr:FAD-dependent thymidylate synthase [Magnetococcales bacterium]
MAANPDKAGSTFQSETTRELREEMNTRCQLNPDFAQHIGNFGFLELEDSWGDEATIINTARISTTNHRLDNLADFDGKDRNLLYHLLSHNHGTPFETVHFRWRIIAPIFVLRQWMRHRICSFNEFSQRYRTPINAFYIPDAPARTVDGFEVLTQAQIDRYETLMESLHQFYQDEYESTCQRLEAAQASGEIETISGGRNPYRARARELLRNAMPVSTYSDLYWTINFRSLMNFFSLRCKPDAQYEIRQFADAGFEMFKRRFPLLAETMDRVLAEREAKS